MYDFIRKMIEKKPLSTYSILILILIINKIDL